VHVTQEQIDSCKSLLEATMPNGQKYEDWLKSKDQEENKKSDGSSWPPRATRMASLRE
jgi:hypothetical protein